MSDASSTNGSSARQPDVIVIGAGLAGLVATLELLEHGRSVVLLDRCRPDEVGGLAREAFGGMFMVDTPEQRRSGIEDSEELALDDWLGMAEPDLGTAACYVLLSAVLLWLGAGEGHPIAPGWTARGGIGRVSDALAAAAPPNPAELEHITDFIFKRTS